MPEKDILRLLYVARTRRPRKDFDALHQVVQNADGGNPLPTHSDVMMELQIVHSQKEALRAIQELPPRVIFVELAGPESRLQFCRTLQSRLTEAHFVAVGEETANAAFPFHDHLTLPLHSSAILALLTPLVAARYTGSLRRGIIELNADQRTVTTPRGGYHMTPKQSALLQLLMENAGNVVSRQEIMQQIWDTNYMDDTRTLDVHIRWLRERIEQDPSAPQLLVTVRGRGYRLAIEE